MATRKAKTKRPRACVERYPKQVRRTVTIPFELDREAHELVGEREFSALVTRGLMRELQAKRIDAIITEYEQLHGAITAEEIEAARKRIYEA